MSDLPLWLPWRAAATPLRLALVAPDGSRLSYAELHRRSDLAARRLGALDVRTGDRLGVLLPNGATFAAVAHAAMRLGAVLLPLNLRLTPRELAWQLNDAGARVLVCAGSTAVAATAVRSLVPETTVVSADDDDDSVDGGDDASGGRSADALTRTAPRPIVSLRDVTPTADTDLRDYYDSTEPLAIVYTSGTTGTPKGAILTYGNFWWSAMGSALNLGIHDDDRWLAPLPLFHVGGLSVLTRSTIYGTAAVIHDGFDAARVSAAIDEERVTLVSLVPTMLSRLLDVRGTLPFPSSLRCVLLGGGPASTALLERCAALGVRVAQTYGLTESCSQAATLPPDDSSSKPGSAGRPLYPTEIRIVRDDGGDAGAGEAGEITLRGPAITPGYWNNPEATARALSDGWLHTGDIGQLDDAGYLYVLDRRDDLIVSGGENVYPTEVEDALLSHPAVAEVAVIGVADEEWGQRVVAVVRLAMPDASEVTELPDVEALQLHCRTLLAGYKVPREIRLTTQPLPRTASGKVKRGSVDR